MDNLTDFFAAPRKAKVKEVQNKVEVKVTEEVIEESKIEENDLKAKQEDLKVSLDKAEVAVEAPKERYKATPKAKIERKFDNFVGKKININDEDYLLLSSMERNISFQKNKIKSDKPTNRITANTIIRFLIEDFCLKASNELDENQDLYIKLLTEDSLKDWIKEVNSTSYPKDNI